MSNRLELLQEVIGSSSALTERFSDFQSQIMETIDQSKGEQFLTSNFPDKDSSMLDIQNRINQVDGILQSLKNARNIDLVPSAFISTLATSIASLSDDLAKVKNHMSNGFRQNGELKSFNPENFHFVFNNGNQFDGRDSLNKIYEDSEKYLGQFHQLIGILRPSKANFSFQAASRSLADLLKENQEKYSDFVQSNVQINSVLDEASSKLQKVVVSLNSVTADYEKVKDESSKITAALADVIEKSASIEEVRTKASSLEAKVEAYSESLGEFDERLASRNAIFSEGTKNLIDLTASIGEKEKEIEGLIERSETMLKGATVAALAKSFNDIKVNLTKELFWARISYYLSIVFLVLFSLPLVIFVFSPILVPVMKVLYPEQLKDLAVLVSPTGLTDLQFIAQIVGRFVILLPSLLLVRFAAVRHASLFRLREHYSYKYSMAVSMEGFKKEAVGYESEVAALVLEQLAFNPADRLVSSSKIPEAQTPMLDSFLRFFRSKTDSRDKAD